MKCLHLSLANQRRWGWHCSLCDVKTPFSKWSTFLQFCSLCQKKVRILCLIQIQTKKKSHFSEDIFLKLQNLERFAQLLLVNNQKMPSEYKYFLYSVHFFCNVVDKLYYSIHHLLLLCHVGYNMITFWIFLLLFLNKAALCCSWASVLLRETGTAPLLKWRFIKIIP